ncbi:hypothetical protein ACFLWI_01670 [Chloroflexota bacterium]
MTSEIYEVVSPLGEEIFKERQDLAPRLDTLEGKTICEVWNGGFQGEVSFPIIRKMLHERYPNVRVIPYSELPLASVGSMRTSNKAKILEAVSVSLFEKGCDAVITGNGC